jgi:hypothetical protein
VAAPDSDRRTARREEIVFEIQETVAVDRPIEEVWAFVIRCELAGNLANPKDVLEAGAGRTIPGAMEPAALS